MLDYFVNSNKQLMIIFSIPFSRVYCPDVLLASCVVEKINSSSMLRSHFSTPTRDQREKKKAHKSVCSSLSVVTVKNYKTSKTNTKGFRRWCICDIGTNVTDGFVRLQIS